MEVVIFDNRMLVILTSLLVLLLVFIVGIVAIRSGVNSVEQKLDTVFPDIFKEEKRGSKDPSKKAEVSNVEFKRMLETVERLDDEQLKDLDKKVTSQQIIRHVPKMAGALSVRQQPEVASILKPRRTTTRRTGVTRLTARATKVSATKIDQLGVEPVLLPRKRGRPRKNPLLTT